MTLRYATLALVALSGLLYFGVARPRHTASVTAEEEYRQARDERSKTRLRLAQAARDDARHRAAREAMEHWPPSGATLAAVRRTLLASLSSAPIHSVRLEVRTGRAPVAARARVTADGRFVDLVALSAKIARPDSGLALDHVALTRQSGSGAHMELEAFALGSQ